MTARLLGVDPSTRILSTLQDALPGVPVGFDMPAGARNRSSRSPPARTRRR